MVSAQCMLWIFNIYHLSCRVVPVYHCLWLLSLDYMAFSRKLIHFWVHFFSKDYFSSVKQTNNIYYSHEIQYLQRFV